MDDFKDYEDQELIDELGIDAWAVVLHEGALRETAWTRFNAAAQVLQLRYPPPDPVPRPR